ncbi:membrane insertase OXA1/ALB3/YidC, partial [Syncephalis plumigaleata]
PWWVSLVLGTILVRTVATLPLAVMQQKSTARLLQLQPMLKAWQNTMARQLSREAREKQWNYTRYNMLLQRQYKEKMRQLYWQHRCHPAMGLTLVAVQMPLFISMSLAVRRLCGLPVPWLEALATQEMAQPQAGGLWWTDLTATDPTLVLPVIIGLVHLANVELNTNKNKSPTVWQQRIRYILRGVSIASIPIATQLPTAVCIYWCTSAFYSLAQNVTFQRPIVQRWLGYPQTEQS